MPNVNKQLSVVVIYRKRKHGKAYLEVFENWRIDDIIDSKKKNPPIPHKYEILDIGIGSKLIKKYKIKHKIK